MFQIIILLFSSLMLPPESVDSNLSWVNPDSILISDNIYAETRENESIIFLSISDPSDTSGVIDSIKVLLEQSVSDTTKAKWYIIPVINGIPDTPSRRIPGTDSETVIPFDITGSISSWNDLINLNIELHTRKGTGPPPDWYADYLQVKIYSTSGVIEETEKNYKIDISSFVDDEVIINFKGEKPSIVNADIYDCTGRLLLSEKFNPKKNNRIEIDRNKHFYPGVHFLNLRLNGYKRRFKFIILER